MRRVLSTLAIAVGLAGLPFAPSASAAAGWHSETPVADGIGVPAPLGEIGDVEFWAPNRGALITAGNDGVPPGVFAYDGSGWHRYSTVCGGHEGSIAWVGPDEFWTVSDYAARQEGNANPTREYARTLCRFDGGQVVASYAEPFGSATAYQRMNAAACNGPGDCWFGGEPLPETSPNTGPFHLHWDGGSLTAFPSLLEPQPQVEDPAGAVTGLGFVAGTLYESASEAPFLREVSLLRPGIFTAVPLPEGTAGPFELSGDGGQLWAVSSNGSSVLRSIGAGFEAIPAELPPEKVTALGAEPGAASAWVGGRDILVGAGEVAKLTRIDAGGGVSSTLTLPEPWEGISGKGGAAAIACPSSEQCWLATSKGWLFHLGGPLPQDTDPAMHALITFRPADNSTRTFVPGGVPEDNSGEVEKRKTPFEEVAGEKFPERRKRRSLVAKVHQRVIGTRVLELSFVLRARAHVRLLAKYHRKVVAKTPRLTLAKGPHRLRLRLDPKRWPTGLDFQVHAAGKRSA